jgi:carotenoid cleavage dioxygenase-like enzyme
LDSTIDFHCVNPRALGKQYRYSWIVSHERIRNPNGGKVENVKSTLHKIDLAFSTDDPLSYDPSTTVTQSMTEDSDNWSPGSSYLRTPLFVARKGATKEDDGFLFAWSYDDMSQGNKMLENRLLVFDAQSMELLLRVSLDEILVPYSVHSAVYSQEMRTFCPVFSRERTETELVEVEQAGRNYVKQMVSARAPQQVGMQDDEDSYDAYLQWKEQKKH